MICVATLIGLTLVYYMARHAIHVHLLHLLRGSMQYLDEEQLPTHVVNIPGLGQPSFPGPWCRFLFDGHPDGTTLPEYIYVPPPGWFDLGTDAFIARVHETLRALPATARIALVGSSRGAGVALRYILHHHDPRIQCLLMLNGPFFTAGDVLRHRLGEGLGTWLIEQLKPYIGPENLAQLIFTDPLFQQPEKWPRLLFVTSDGDTNLPPRDVKQYASRFGQQLLVLGADAGHTLYFGSLGHKKLVQDFVLNAIRKEGKMDSPRERI